MRPLATATLTTVAVVACGSPGGPPREPGAARAPIASIASIAAELDAMSGGITAPHRATFEGILATTLAEDGYACHPAPRDVFFADVDGGERRITGELPHYGFYYGPMSYRLARKGGRWRVRVTLALDPPRGASKLELPDCELVRAVGGDPQTCRGISYAKAPGTDACPASGTFEAPATPSSVRALLDRWSRDVEGYWNRDAAFFGLPIDYDFRFVLADQAEPDETDLRMPLSPTCGRTPYFTAFRSGWSLPIAAHEVGHVLGLLDEYEALSGISRAYPKTPFPGAEKSRMGLSMREDTRVLPLHHYLVVRRWFCTAQRSSFHERAPL